MKERLFANDVEENLAIIEEKIEKACSLAGRKREEITLVGVSKTFDEDRVNLAIDAGLKVLGENRVQEILRKKPQLKLENAEMHLIGHLQTNKVKSIVGQVDMIQSVDSVRVANAIEKCSADLEIDTKILVEVNIGKEEKKSGVYAEYLADFLEEISQNSHLKICGLMCVPPICESKSEISRYFCKMNELFLDISNKKLDNVSMKVLSMGMSSDFEEAIREGSTMVRIGTALFGKRFYPQNNNI